MEAGALRDTADALELRDQCLALFKVASRDDVSEVWQMRNRCTERLDRGVFKIPQLLEVGAKTVVVDERVLDDLLDGIDVERRPPRSAVH
jgi:hypothetical protein